MGILHSSKFRNIGIGSKVLPATGLIRLPRTAPSNTVPATPTSKPNPVRLKNGTVVKRFIQAGLGVFQIENGTSSDAVVVFVEQGVAYPDRAALYVRANSRRRSDGSCGTYQVAFELGSDWNERRRFNESTERSAFENVATFEETPSYSPDGQDSILYSQFKATLHAAGGNVRSKPVDESLL